MISVSNSFKKAIKSDERECKGYVEIITKNYVDKTKYSISSSTSNIAEITTYNQINDNKRVAHKYASFEKNYFLLDGSFILPSLGENLNAGYISDSVSYEEDDKHYNGELSNLEIKITSSIEKCEGITLYFDDEIYPTNLYYFQNGQKIEIDNDSSMLNIFHEILFENGSFSIYFTRLNNPNRRLRIIEIDLGITNVYKNNELISFEIVEEIDVLKEEMPINECNLTLNNYDGRFDSINPQGIAKYLDGSIVKPYIGVLTEDVGIEYCPCGVFYIYEWKNNSETTTNLTCYSFFKKLSEVDNYTVQYATNYMDIESYIKYLFEMWGYSNYEFNGITDNKYISDYFSSKMNRLDKLREILVFTNLIGYSNRYGNTVISNLSNVIVDVLKLEQQKKVPTISNKNIISSIIINKIASSNEISSNEKVILEQTFDITGEYNQKIVLTYDENLMVYYTSDKIQANVVTSQYGFGFIFLEFNANHNFLGTIDTPVSGETTIKLIQNGNKQLIYTPTTFETGNNGDSIEIKNALFNFMMQTYIDKGLNYGMKLSDAIENTKKFILAQNHQYEVNIDYNGDPSLEAGDLIGVETRYGLKTIRIKELTLTFNGTLSGTIVGVGD